MGVYGREQKGARGRRYGGAEEGGVGGRGGTDREKARGKGTEEGESGGEAWGRENGEEAKAGIDLSLSS